MKLDRVGFSETQKIVLWVLATVSCFVAMLAFDRSLPFKILWISLTSLCFLFVFFKFVNSRYEAISEAEINSTHPISPNYKVVIRRPKLEKNDETYDESPLSIFASNGQFSGSVDIFADIQELKKIGEALAVFPKKIDDAYFYSYYRTLQIEAYTLLATGRCGIQFEIDLSRRGLAKTCSIFSIVVYPAEIATLGRLLVDFAESTHMEFQWSRELSTTSEKWKAENDYLFSDASSSKGRKLKENTRAYS